jgi:hypothetical protein
MDHCIIPGVFLFGFPLSYPRNVHAVGCWADGTIAGKSAGRVTLSHVMGTGAGGRTTGKGKSRKEGDKKRSHDAMSEVNPVVDDASSVWGGDQSFLVGVPQLQHEVTEGGDDKMTSSEPFIVAAPSDVVRTDQQPVSWKERYPKGRSAANAGWRQGDRLEIKLLIGSNAQFAVWFEGVVLHVSTDSDELTVVTSNPSLSVGTIGLREYDVRRPEPDNSKRRSEEERLNTRLRFRIRSWTTTRALMLRQGGVAADATAEPAVPPCLRDCDLDIGQTPLPLRQLALLVDRFGGIDRTVEQRCLHLIFYCACFDTPCHTWFLTDEACLYVYCRLLWPFLRSTVGVRDDAPWHAEYSRLLDKQQAINTAADEARAAKAPGKVDDEGSLRSFLCKARDPLPPVPEGPPVVTLDPDEPSAPVDLTPPASTLPTARVAPPPPAPVVRQTPAPGRPSSQEATPSPPLPKIVRPLKAPFAKAPTPKATTPKAPTPKASGAKAPAAKKPRAPRAPKAKKPKLTPQAATPVCTATVPLTPTGTNPTSAPPGSPEQLLSQLSYIVRTNESRVDQMRSELAAKEEEARVLRTRLAEAEASLATSTAAGGDVEQRVARSNTVLNHLVKVTDTFSVLLQFLGRRHALASVPMSPDERTEVYDDMLTKAEGTITELSSDIQTLASHDAAQAQQDQQ